MRSLGTAIASLAAITALASAVSAETGGAPSLDLEADRLELDLEAREATAERVRLSACGDCGRPWTVTARRARLRSNGDLELLLPVLRIGPVPVFALPWLLVRRERRPGLLMPRLGFRSGGGFEVGQGFWAPLGPAADLALGASWLSDIGGARVDARLEADQVWLDASVHAGTEAISARLRGGGGVRSGRFDANAAVDWSYDPDVARRLAPTPQQEARPYEVTRVTLSHSTPTLQLSLGSELVQGLLPDDLSTSPPVPLSEVAVDLLPVGAGPMWASARLSHRFQWLPGGGWPGWRVLAEPRLRGLFRLGPVLIRASAASLHALFESDSIDGASPASRNLVGLGLDLSSPLFRQFGASLRHTVVPSVIYRLSLVDVMTGGVPATGFDPAAWPVGGHFLAVALESSLRGPHGRGLEIEAVQVLDLPRLAGAAAGPRLDLRISLDAALARLDLEAALDEWPIPRLSEGGARGSIGGSRADFSFGWRWIGEGHGPLTGPDPRADLPVQIPFLPARAHAGFALLNVAPLRELRFGGGAWVDLGAGELLVAGGRVAYENRCGCLAAALEVWHRRGRRWPDVLLLVDVGGIGGR